jgi:putative transposase
MIRACSVVGLSRATAYRRLRPRAGESQPNRRVSHRRIPDQERAGILEVLDSDRFVDQPPREVYATLLSEGIYLCSPRSMYRLLRARGPLRERRDHRERGPHPVPRLVATAPNQVWTWDISKLATHNRGEFLNLYVILDLFSRYVVAWMVAAHENSALAKQLFAEAIGRYRIEPGNLTVHQDRGAPMTAHGFADLLAELGVDRSYSRPRVSDDNAFSESQFHTLKYQPDYPGRFRDIRHARLWCEEFFDWYNNAHHHDGLALFTPGDVFHGRIDRLAAQRQAALNAAFLAHPERFPLGAPSVRLPPAVVRINPIDPGDAPLTAAAIIAARDEELASLLTPAPRPSTAPILHLPGIPRANPGAAAARPLQT